jgi:prepilin-type N-terminal cleavage/methylation domain-containing protein
MTKHAPRAPGFTLLEILTVLAVISILLGLMVVAIAKTKGDAEADKTAATISKIKMALTVYESRFGECPAGPGNHAATWPAPYDPAGVELDAWFLEHVPKAREFSKSEKDPSDPAYFVDAWGRRLRYRKSGPKSCLVWSAGKDGVDQIGTGNRPRAGDDISSDGVR